MKVNYFFGNAGTGKFTNCVSNILKRQDNNQKSILIIPEQFTMQAEKQIILNSKSKIIFNTHVLNFKRLAHRIFEELGLPKEKPLEDIGQIMVIRKILYTLGKEKKLKYFSETAYNNIGLLEKLMAIIKEFFQFELNLDMLEDTIKCISDDDIINNSSINQNLILKLEDLKNIYKLYKQFLEKEYVTDESILELLFKSIDDSNLIDDKTHIFIYGFEEFNNQELNILYKLFEKCEEVNLYFTLNSKETYYKEINIFDYYYNVKQTITKIQDKILTPLSKTGLVNIVNEDNSAGIFKVETNVVLLQENFRHKNNLELKHLEKNFLSHKPDIYNNKNIKNIKITSAKNKYIEIENVSEQIFNIIKSENYNFRDIVIILGDSSYESPLKMIFNKYNIPYFLDDKKAITNHSLVELIISSLEIILHNYQYEHIFRYLKTGYFENVHGLNNTDINLLENYVLKHGIKGKRWHKEFIYGFDENSPYSQNKMNNIRENFLSSLSKLNFTKTKKYTVLHLCKSIFDFLVDIKIEENIKFIMKRDKNLFEQNIIKNTGNLDEHIQVFNSIGEILQKFVDILGDEKLKLEEFLKILKSAFEKETISIIPPKQDQILIGNFDRTKITNNKVIFLLAVNEGCVPSYKEESPFISDIEKVVLKNNGIEMRNTSTTMLATDMLKIYSLMLKPEDKIFISYATSSLESTIKKPSSIIGKIKSIFPDLVEEKVDAIKLNLYSTHEIIFDNLFKNFNDLSNIYNDKELQEVFKWFLNIDSNKKNNYAEKLVHIKNSIEKLENNSDNIISQEYLQKMYNDNRVFLSVSKLEEFNKCPFSYFLKYNLNVRERDVYVLDALKLGNLYHEILEKFSHQVFKKNSEKNNEENKIQENKIQENINTNTDLYYLEKWDKSSIYTAIEDIIKDISETNNLEGLIKDYPKYSYYFERIKKITTMSVEALIQQLKAGNFTPQEFEVKFNNISDNSSIFEHIKIPLDITNVNNNNNYEIILNGTIDRIDKMNIANQEYIKIIDYKSSDKKLSLNSIYHGIQLQLLMYLSIVLKIENDVTQNLEKKEVKPAGAFYFQVQEAVLDESIEYDEKNKMAINIDNNNNNIDINNTNIIDRKYLEKLEKEFALKGVISENKEVLLGFDKKIDLKKKKIGSVDSGFRVQEDELDKILKLCNIIAKDIGEDIVKGNIKVEPYKFGNDTGCDYCNFKEICSFDLVEKNSQYKYLEAIPDKELWKNIGAKIDKLDKSDKIKNTEDEDIEDENIEDENIQDKDIKDK